MSQTLECAFNFAFRNTDHDQWEFLKYEIQKFSIEFSKNKTKLSRGKLLRLERKLKVLEQNLMKQKNHIMCEAKLMKSTTK